MRILLISFSGIGDTLIATPCLRELRQRYPQASLEALVRWPGSRSLLEGNPHLDAIHQKDMIADGLASSWPFLRALRRRRYDVSINVHTQGRIHYRAVARIIGARIRISHAYENHGWLDRRLVNRTIPQDYAVHSVINNQRLLDLLEPGPHPEAPDYELFLREEETNWAAGYARAQELASHFTWGLHVGSGSTKNLSLKRWPLDHYLLLLERLVASRPDIRILLFGGPEEQEAHAAIRQRISSPALLVPETKSLRQAAALLRHCRGFLSVDTALMHLAAAMKVPHQLVIEAPTLNATNMPWNNPCRVIRNPAVNGRNLDYYRYDGRPIQGTREELLRCMQSVTVEEVYRAMVEATTLTP